MTYRVLLVDDYGLWRHYLSSALRASLQWQIVGEASDGLGAVQKAEELNPDLILLDIGLPTLNGIQAARRMIATNPSSRILFVSEQRSWDIAEAALNTGACGYVVKTDVGRDLLPAMEAVVGGRRFISARFAGRGVETANDKVSPQALFHEAGFYSNEPSLLDDYAYFAEATLGAGSALIVIVPDSRRHKVHQRLQARGVDVDRAIKDGRYVSLDMATALSSVMVDGWPDEARFWNSTHSLIMRAARASKGNHPHVATCGECAPSLLNEGRAAAAIRLEQLWDEVARTYDMDIFCGYPLDVPPSGEQSHIFRDICAAHSAVHWR